MLWVRLGGNQRTTLSPLYAGVDLWKGGQSDSLERRELFHAFGTKKKGPAAPERGGVVPVRSGNQTERKKRRNTPLAREKGDSQEKDCASKRRNAVVLLAGNRG